MAGRVAGRKALIWGGGTGLGLSAARCLAREGAQVFLAGRRGEKLVAAAAAIPGSGQATGDVTVEADIARVTAAAVKAMGGLDTLVLSSGMSSKGSIVDAKVADFRQLMETNVTAVFLATQHAVAALTASGDGSVIAIASIAGMLGVKDRVAYCTSKSAVHGMVRAMAMDLAGKGVRVNSISPGLIVTDLVNDMLAKEADPRAALAARTALYPMGRLGEVDHIGQAVVYLASSDSGWMTGQNMVIDGGITVA